MSSKFNFAKGDVPVPYSVYKPDIHVNVRQIEKIDDQVVAVVVLTRPGKVPFRRRVSFKISDLDEGPGALLSGCTFDVSGLSFEEQMYLRVCASGAVSRAYDVIEANQGLCLIVRGSQRIHTPPPVKEWVN